jgi:hypothetical protein
MFLCLSYLGLFCMCLLLLRCLKFDKAYLILILFIKVNHFSSVFLLHCILFGIYLTPEFIYALNLCCFFLPAEFNSVIGNSKESRSAQVCCALLPTL